jgi:hypothetical protein
VGNIRVIHRESGRTAMKKTLTHEVRVPTREAVQRFIDSGALPHLGGKETPLSEKWGAWYTFDACNADGSVWKKRVSLTPAYYRIRIKYSVSTAKRGPTEDSQTTTFLLELAAALIASREDCDR